MSEATSGRSRRILVVSGRRLIAEALQDLLLAQPSVETCVAVCDAARLRDTDTHTDTGFRPSTVIIDLDEPGCDRSDLTWIVERSPEARRMGFYDAFTSPNAQTAFELGLTVLLPLSSSLEHVVHLVLADRRDSSATRAVGMTPLQLARLNSLTPRELEVLDHIARGRPVKVVAGLLGITVHTVETHKRRCFAKLGVQHQAHAVTLAASAGMISPS